MARGSYSRVKSCGNSLSRGIFGPDSAPAFGPPPNDAPSMTLLSTAHQFARGSRRTARGPMIPIMAGCGVAARVVALVAYLLWPTWGPDPSSGPARLPVSIGCTLFNVPTTAVRMKIQRHSGPQERVDLSFMFPSLQPHDAPKHVSAD